MPAEQGVPVILGQNLVDPDLLRRKERDDAGGEWKPTNLVLFHSPTTKGFIANVSNRKMALVYGRDDCQHKETH
jgi:hypothetical protein